MRRKKGQRRDARRVLFALVAIEVARACYGARTVHTTILLDVSALCPFRDPALAVIMAQVRLRLYIRTVRRLQLLTPCIESHQDACRLQHQAPQPDPLYHPSHPWTLVASASPRLPCLFFPQVAAPLSASLRPAAAHPALL